jgi:methylenetetrahydrofolate reductase (NADPH)
MSENTTSIGHLVREGGRSFSFEFFPPRDEAGEAQLWQAIRDLEPYHPTFVSVTYGAGGSTRDSTVEITSRIARETSLLPMAHLTCVGHTKEELEDVLTSYAEAGVANVMLLRGDPQEGPRAEWTPTEGGFTHAVELVELAASRSCFSIGVAAFPEGHPSAESLEHDAQVLVDKARAGAEFAVTQMFFDAGDYFSLVERVRALGADLPIVPGIMPILNLGAITRQGELIGTSVPDWVVRSFDGLTEPAEIRANGIRLATQLCQDLLDGGAPGLHFYTLNRSKATREIFEALRITV